MNTNRRKSTNPINALGIAKWLLPVVFGLIAGLAYTSIKTQQYALGDNIRKTERFVREARAENEVLLARVTELSSRSVLQERIAQGFPTLIPIQDNVIARLSPATLAVDDGIMRTAFNERNRP